MGCGPSRWQSRVVPGHPAGGEMWTSPEYSYPNSQGGYPTLLPHQLSYTLAANSQPPPPYSREPLAGHLSVWKAEDPQVMQDAANRRQLASQNELTVEIDSQSRRDCGSHDGHGQTATAERSSTRRRHSRRHRRQMTHSSDPAESVNGTTDGRVSAEPEPFELEQHRQPPNEGNPNLSSSPVNLQATIELPLPSMPMIVSATHDVQSDELMSSDEIMRPCSRQSLRTSSTLFVPAGGDGSRPPHLIRRSPTPTSSNFVPPAFLPRPGSDNESVLPINLPPPLRSITTPERNLPPLQSISPSGISMDTSPIQDEWDQHAGRSRGRLNPVRGHKSKKSLSFPRMLPQPQPLPSRLPPLSHTVNNDPPPSGTLVDEQGPSRGDWDEVAMITVNAGEEEQSSNRRSLSDSVEDNPTASTLESSQDSNSSEVEQDGTLSRQASVSRQSSKNSNNLGTVTASEKIDHQISETVLLSMIT